MASKKKVRENNADKAQTSYAELLQETEAVKRLLVLFLIKLGVSSQELGTALGVDGSVVRRMIPSRSIKKFDFGAGRTEEE